MGKAGHVAPRQLNDSSRNMNLHLYLVISEKRPDIGGSGEDLLIAGEDTDPDQIPPESLCFMTTVLFRNSDPACLFQDFERWWSDSGGGTPRLDLLADRAEMIDQDRAAEAKDLDEHSWIVRASFVAYPAAADEARAEARKIILEAELRQH
jgi:hypothetical protein